MVSVPFSSQYTLGWVKDITQRGSRHLVTDYQAEIQLEQWYKNNDNLLGPVVQWVVSLTSVLRVISLTVLAESIYNILIFFADKMWVAFALQKLLTFFQQKIQHICISLDVNFNESLTNDVISFEKLGPGLQSNSWQ